MTTLFDPAVNSEILDRLNKLDPSLQPKWGKMKAEQMLAHLNLALQVNFGEIKLKRGLLGMFFRGISRRILLGAKPFPKHLPTDKKLLPKEVSAFLVEKQKVESRVKMYLEKGPDGLSKDPHNILGKITPERIRFYFLQTS